MRNSCRGAALVVALLVVALSTALSTHLLWQSGQWFGQQESLRDQAQAREIAYAGLMWARAVLAEDVRVNAYDHDREPWATIVPVSEAEGGFVSGQLLDEQAKWNINNLIANGEINQYEWDTFRRLLLAVDLPASLVVAVADWMDADREVREGGAENSYYRALTPGYLPRNGMLASLDELIYVRGFDSAAVERLRPLVTALPSYTSTNVNDASAEVLAAILSDFSNDDIQRIISERRKAPFKSLEDVFQRTFPQATQGSQEFAGRLNVKTDFFAVRVSATHGRSVIDMKALLNRKQPGPDIVWLKLE